MSLCDFHGETGCSCTEDNRKLIVELELKIKEARQAALEEAIKEVEKELPETDQENLIGMADELRFIGLIERIRRLGKNEY